MNYVLGTPYFHAWIGAVALYVAVISTLDYMLNSKNRRK